ncbi:hypothetical protein ACHAXS_014252 [Conticribra weissflogii]
MGCCHDYDFIGGRQSQWNDDVDLVLRRKTIASGKCPLFYPRLRRFHRRNGFVRVHRRLPSGKSPKSTRFPKQCHSVGIPPPSDAGTVRFRLKDSSVLSETLRRWTRRESPIRRRRRRRRRRGVIVFDRRKRKRRGEERFRSGRQTPGERVELSNGESGFGSEWWNGGSGVGGASAGVGSAGGVVIASFGAIIALLV